MTGTLPWKRVDKKGGVPWKPTIYRDKVVTMMEEFSLVDVFRKQNPTKKTFTYLSKALKLSSRIDYFLVAQLLTNQVSQSDTIVSIAPDHNAVKLQLTIPQGKRGPGLWKFNNSLLEDEDYIELIKANFPVIREKYLGIGNERLKWELLKMEIRDITISFSKNKAKLLRKREQEIQNRLKIIDSFISCAAHTDCTDENEKEYANLKCELDLIYERKGQGSILRSKTRWTEQGEKPTKYFFNLERRNYNLKTIKKLERSQGEFLTKKDDILKEIESLYTKLYASVLLDDNDLFDSFVQNLDIPKLDDTQRDRVRG